MIESKIKTHHNIEPLREALAEHRRAGQRVAFVPTMGNLHAGHLSLVEQAKAYADCVVVSVFVNPLQFAADEDFSSYPRTLERDQTLLAQAGADWLFAPTPEMVYPSGVAEQTQVLAPPLISQRLCGASRPTHFTGVCTIVCKLLNWIQPQVMVLGAKDFQQVCVLKRMILDLGYAVEVLSAPIVRAEDGLALSSRNQYLNELQRKIAPQLYQNLNGVAQAVRDGNKDFAGLIEQASHQLSALQFQIDYFEVCDTRTLQPATEQTPAEFIVILIAAFLGKVRLIDNVAVIS